MRSDRDAIVVHQLTKTFRAGVGRARVREMLPPPTDRAIARVFPSWWAKNTFKALDSVSFSIPRGESLGLVGHNGAGKTTMLKVLAGITYPTSGVAHVNGRVAALIDILVGFHPDLTGRENVYLLGAVYGFGRTAMRSRMDRILEFAEIDELAGTPLKRYSTGMVARLGFAIIASLDADALLVDEILAVGDANFQQKCVRWLDDYRASGGTLVFVSHNLALVRSMTKRAVWLDHGRVMAEGPTEDVLSKYGRAMEYRETQGGNLRKDKARRAVVARGMYRWGAGGARLEHVHVEEPSYKGEPCTLAIDYVNGEIDEAVFCIGFIDQGGREIGGAASPPLELDREKGAVFCEIHPLPLRPGIYFPVVSVLSRDGIVRDKWRLDRAVVIEQNGVPSFENDLGPVTIGARWSKRRRA